MLQCGVNHGGSQKRERAAEPYTYPHRASALCYRSREREAVRMKGGYNRDRPDLPTSKAVAFPFE